MSALLLAVLLAAPPAMPPAGDDPVFKALDAEVARAMTLRMPPLPGSKTPSEKPYFVQAMVGEEEVFNAWASFGALQARSGNKTLSVLGKVRVGAPKFDNTNFSDYGGMSFGFGDGRRRVPAEVDLDALRHSLWLQLDESYKGALEALSKKQAFLETNQVAERVDDFGPAPVASRVEPRVALSVDKERWTTLVRKASGVFLDNPALQEGTAWVRAVASHQSMVTSDPARHRFGEAWVQLTLQTQAQAADGMELRVQRRFTGRAEGDLPSDSEVVAAAKALSDTSARLAKAPMAAEDYTGPVLFVDQAAALFFLQTIGDPLSLPREPLGSRPSGRMLDRLGKRVAARFITAKDDPTQKEWTAGGRAVPLWGHYPIDDDSVLPQPITLVDAGALKTYYMSRVPTQKLKGTNGHCRGEQGAPGNLFVETAAPTARAALKKQLVELAKDEDFDYGLMVEQAEEFVPRAYGNEGMRLSTPVLVWRVYADGREELVRGLTFKPVSQRVLKEVVAMGDDAYVLNLEHRGQRTSVVAPSVLVRLMELTRTKQDFEKPPLTPRP